MNELNELEKKRRWYVSATLWLMLISTSFSLIGYCLALIGLVQLPIKLPFHYIVFYIGASLFNIVCIVALFKWRKWAFYGICLISFLVFSTNIAVGIDIIAAAMGFIMPLILFGLLKLGGERKAWPQLI